MAKLSIAQPRIALIDPQDCTDSADSLAMLDAVFDPLVRRLGPGRFAPALAEEWQQQDSRTTLFRLRPGATFHDGTACDAEAVARSLRRMADPAVGATLGAAGVWAQYLAGSTVTTINSRTLRLVTTRDIADILDIVAAGPIVAPSALGRADIAGRWVGTGPWRLGGHDDDGVRMIATQPGLPELHWRRMADPQERIGALHDGTADIATRIDPASTDAPSHTVTDPTAIICLLNAARGPCADPRVRRALNLAIDRPALIAAVLHGHADPLAGFVSPRHFGFDPAAQAARHDPAAARRLLAASGHDGLALTAGWPTRLPDEAPTLLPALQAQLAAIGVTLSARIEPDRVRYAERVRDSDIADICLFDSSPMSSFRVLAEKIDSRVAGAWWLGYRNADVE
ncbi:MAG: peptide ABC transporter substrate-binding protein, partial [Acetobacteraceae bacterium]|nr:peptide ABC transporter substrate-binding protein [Acetobacteraceae bacterium]